MKGSDIMNATLENLCETEGEEFRSRHIVCDMPRHKLHRYDVKYDIEDEVTSAEKLEFLDKLTDGKISKKLALLEKYAADCTSFETTRYGTPLVRAIKKWVRDNNAEELIIPKSGYYNSTYYCISAWGAEVDFNDRIFVGGRDKNYYVDLFFGKYLSYRERMECFACSRNDSDGKAAKRFDHETWNKSLLAQMLETLGLGNRLCCDKYGRDYIEGVKTDENDNKLYLKLTTAEFDMLRSKRDEVLAFMKSLADTPEIKALYARFESEGTPERLNY
ncbi:MAG: hypothetical protein IJK26_09405 [Clostridia bacterium]|nr:hypothetical protein [Clostridia bacterium]